MKTTILALTLLLPGCAHGLDKSIDGVEKFAAGVKVGVDGSVTMWDAGVDAKVAYCAAKLGEDSTEAQRAKCMGILGRGEKAEPALEKMRDGYDLVAEGLELLREAQKELEPYLEAAEKAAGQ
jgi:hypothetical protein